MLFSRLLKNAHLSRWSGIALIMLHFGLQKVRLISYDFARLAFEHF